MCPRLVRPLGKASWGPPPDHIRPASLQKPFVPEKPDGFTWRDYLIRGLHTAAELEHLLMVEYLYAAYSLGGEQLSSSDSQLARHWQDILLAIAKEEMGHLLTVQNVLCFVGGPVRFGRDDVAGATPFPFRLERLSVDSILRYLCGEMPNLATVQLAPQIPAKQLKQVEHWLAQGASSPHAGPPVGELYQLLLAILSDPRYVPDHEFRPETYAFQASWDDWGRGYRLPPNAPDGRPLPMAGDDGRSPLVHAEVLVDRVSTRTEAVAALQKIASQGENPSLTLKGTSETSHFAHFLCLLEEFEHGGERLVRPVATNPTAEVRERQRPPGSTPITAKHSRRWASLFNLRYRMLLAYLTHTFRHARVVDTAKPNTRGMLMHRVFGEMYNVKTLSGLLVRMPLTDKPVDQGPDGQRAGPPFGMPYTLSLPLDETDCWKQYSDVLSGAQQLCRELLSDAAAGESIGPSEGASYLRSLMQLDQQTLAWIDRVLAGQRASGRSRT